ncbi:MAG: HD domain-containing protein [Pirellulales bacterium]
MTSDRLRREIAHEAARLLYTREESEYLRAKLKAAKRFCPQAVTPQDLPSNLEVRELLLSRTLLFEGSGHTDTLRKMRLCALRAMRMLDAFRPRLIGSVLTGHVRRGSDVDVHLFADSLDPIAAILDAAAIPYEIERKRVRKQDKNRVYRHIHARDEYPLELTVYAMDQAHVPMISSLTHKKIESAGIAALERLIAEEHPEQPLDAETLDAEARIDRFQMYELLLVPLDDVQQDPRYHPEGDVLYHSLQVYQLARAEVPYDEELLLAALLHDVGKGIDPADHTAAGLEALDGFITDAQRAG